MRRSPEREPAATGALPDLPCACASARRVSRILTQSYDAQLRPHGLESTQFALLSVLAAAGHGSQAEIGQRFGFDKSTLSRNLKLLRTRGWIEVAEGVSGRERPYVLTTAGRKRLEAATPAWRQAQEALRTSMAPSDWEAMWRAFRAIGAAAQLARRRRGAGGNEKSARARAPR